MVAANPGVTRLLRQNDASKSPGNGWSSRHVIAIGNSDSCCTNVPREEAA
jgi:hypothetical protein